MPSPMDAIGSRRRTRVTTPRTSPPPKAPITRPARVTTSDAEVTISREARTGIDGSDRRLYNQAAELKKMAIAQGRTVEYKPGRYVNSSDVHLYRAAEEGEKKAEAARAQGRTVPLNGELVNPSDVHLYNRAAEAEARADARAQGRTVEVNGELVNPSDVHLYRQAAEAEARATADQAATTEPVAAPQAQTPAADEPFILPAGDQDNPYPGHNASQVTVTAWDGVGGKPNDSVITILRNQGYTDQQIYAKNEQGQTLLQEVGAANDLNGDYLIHPGDELIVPTTHPATPEATTQEAAPAPRTTVNVNGQEVDPSDVHLYNQAAEAEKKAAHAQGRTLERNGEWINPSDNHLYNLAAEAERRQAHAEGRTQMVDGQWVDPSDVHLYNRR